MGLKRRDGRELRSSACSFGAIFESCTADGLGAQDGQTSGWLKSVKMSPGFQIVTNTGLFFNQQAVAVNAEFSSL